MSCNFLELDVVKHPRCMSVTARLYLISSSCQDGNIPSGESFIRQFLVGQKFAEAEFGHTCDEV